MTYTVDMSHNGLHVSLPPSRGDMVRVSKETFFATVGRLNVHPTIGQQKWDQVLGYRSDWKTPHGEVLGVTVGGTHLSETEYMVTRAFFEKHVRPHS